MTRTFTEIARMAEPPVDNTQNKGNNAEWKKFVDRIEEYLSLNLPVAARYWRYEGNLNILCLKFSIGGCNIQVKVPWIYHSSTRPPAIHNATQDIERAVERAHDEHIRPKGSGYTLEPPGAALTYATTRRPDK